MNASPDLNASPEVTSAPPMHNALGPLMFLIVPFVIAMAYGLLVK